MLRLGVFIILMALTNPASGEDWGCYDPQPGHPTRAEKIEFLKKVGPIATDAESKYGVPAAAISAMTALESGFGFTRIALNASNFFGWKYTSPAAAGGRQSWTLECQPPDDVNNRYIRFTSIADSIDFVASRLADSEYYRADTRRYQADRSAGVNVKIAASRWIAGIADPYNWRPSEYIRSVIRIMNSPLDPSDTIDINYNLYNLSASATLKSNSADIQSVKRALRGFSYGRYMENNCTPLEVPNWTGFPTKFCKYTAPGSSLTAEVVLLNPSDDQLERWITSACAAAKTNDFSYCGLKIAKHIRAQSGAQFPVAGMVLEDMDGDGRPNQFAFRDGVTVKVDGVVSGKVGGPNPAENNAALHNPPLEAKMYARISGTLREDYVDYIGRQNSPEVRGIAWLAVVREAYQRAWNTDSNDLINAWAVANSASFKKP